MCRMLAYFQAIERRAMGFFAQKTLFPILFIIIENTLYASLNPSLTSKNIKNSLNHQNQPEIIKQVFRLISIISGNGKGKEHLSETSFIKWNPLTLNLIFLWS